VVHHRYAEAIPHLEESVELASDLNSEVFLSNALINLGLAHRRLGDLDSARERLRESVQHAAALEDRGSFARALDGLAAVAVTAEDPELGTTLLGAGEGVRRSIGVGIWRTDRASHDEVATRLPAQLGDTAAFDRGAASTLVRSSI
jgi:tetratricopeptide (TPR) repeat protein